MGADPDATEADGPHGDTTKPAQPTWQRTPTGPLEHSSADLNGGEGVALVPGLRIGGRYELEAEVGRGGMGVVWKARDLTLRETVALKFLPEAVARDPAAMDDLVVETRRARQLTHPNIVRTFDYVRDEHCAAVSMEFIDGQTVARLRRHHPGGAYPASELAPLIKQLCQALHYAHSGPRIVHRDLKPANLLVTANGLLKVADFGIARSLSETRTRLTLRNGAGIAGTLFYMGPQQLFGEKPDAADDIYSLGATLYDLLAGKPPFFRGDVHGVMAQIRERAPAPIAAQRRELGLGEIDLPEGWEKTILQCLVKDPALRPRSAADVALALGLSTATRPPLVTRVKSPCPPPAARGRLSHFIFAGAFAVLLAAGVLFWSRLGPRVETRSESSAPSASAAQASPRPASSDSATRARAEVVITIVPADAAARVWLGPFADVPAKNGLLTLTAVPDGTHELLVHTPGFAPVSESLVVTGGRAEKTIRLTPVLGSLIVAAKAGTTVTAIDARGREQPAGTVGDSEQLEVRNALPVGSYRLRLEHPDCAPVMIDGIDVAVGRTARATAEQALLPGQITVSSDAAGDVVFINDQLAGVTPLAAIAVKAREPVRVRVARPGFRSFATTASAEPRENKRIVVNSLAREAGELFFQLEGRRSPEQLQFSLDGAPVAPERTDAGWRIAAVPIGVHRLTVSQPDFLPWSAEVEIRDGQAARVSVALAARPSTLALDVTGAQQFEVFLNREKQTAGGKRLVLEPDKDHVLEIRAFGFRPILGRVRIPANTERTLPVVLEAVAVPVGGRVHDNALRMAFVPLAGLDVLVSKFETRRIDYERYLHATQRTARAVLAGKDNDPVANVTWQDAVEFCRWLTALERELGLLTARQRYRLPRDEEWSIAAGIQQEAGRTIAEKSGRNPDVFPWGATWPPAKDAGNFAGEEIGRFAIHIAGYSDGFAAVAPVGSFAPGPHGLFDLAGNVWEWCEDDFFPASNLKVMRGGSFRDAGRGSLLSSARNRSPAGEFHDNVGFRCVLALNEPDPAK